MKKLTKRDVVNSEEFRQVCQSLIELDDDIIDSIGYSEISYDYSPVPTRKQPELSEYTQDWESVSFDFLVEKGALKYIKDSREEYKIDRKVLKSLIGEEVEVEEKKERQKYSKYDNLIIMVVLDRRFVYKGYKKEVLQKCPVGKENYKYIKKIGNTFWKTLNFKGKWTKVENQDEIDNYDWNWNKYMV